MSIMIPKSTKAGNPDNKVSCCFFEWLATKLGNLIGWLGGVLGLPTYSQTSEFGGGMRIDWAAIGSPDPMSLEPTTDEGISGSYIYGYGPSFDFESFPLGGPNTSGSAFMPATLIYLIQNLPNLTDAERNWFGQRVTVTEVLARYLQASGGPTSENTELIMWIKTYLDNHPYHDISMDGGMDKLYLVKNLNLSEEEDAFVHAYTAIAKEIAAYLKTNGLGQDTRDYAIWMVKYLNENKYTINFTNFISEFISNSPPLIANPLLDNWTDPDDEVLTDLDQTVYQEYQDNQPWPIIKREDIIPFEKFVPMRKDANGNQVNCLTLSKEQLGKAGYTCSGYLPNTQTFSIYTTQNGVNVTETKKAISYMINALSQKIPVLIGIDNRPGAPLANKDNSTDHYVVVVGMGTDANGKYFQFVDSATDNRSTGASFSNRLYYNTTTNKISGKTAIEGYRNQPNMHDYIITQVRKSIKK